MTFIEKVEKALEIGLVKNTFDNYELFSSDVRRELVAEDIGNVISTSKKILSLVNDDISLYDYEVSELINMVN
jgi:hypothetical protein